MYHLSTLYVSPVARVPPAASAAVNEGIRLPIGTASCNRRTESWAVY